MKKLNTILAFATIMLSAYYFYFQAPRSDTDTITNKNVLVVGISPDYPPYAQIDLETGKVVGLEVDIITEIAHRLDKTLQIKDMPFNSLIIELISGQIDVIAAGLCPTPERKKNILFSTSYIDNDENIVISKKENPEITDLQDLYGKPVAVNIGYTADTFLSNYPQIELVRLKSPADGFMALQTNSVYGFAIAQSIFNNFIKKHHQADDYNFFYLPASTDACALAYAKYSSKLQAEIDPIIQQMIEDGTMQTIKKKWGFA
ncbi:amino acid ABC transporter substrate-binding protein [Candidatus Babeliales bacterium]|nr:amino acid ABC transporter substrate-binding protein [Candidatus Babeliales bacterium]MBP9843458.1 amino acid ABC transporter substrate-binding protein [Candidatus Babeliales bacterium]